MLNVSIHTHCESPLTGSTIATMIKRAVDLKRTHFSYTDLGHMSSALKTHTMAKEAGLKSILGIEFYFKDNNDLIAGTKADRCRYFTGTIFAKNQEAYQEIVKIVSKTNLPKVKINDEFQSLWGWAEIKHLAKFDTMLVLGGVHCIVGKSFLAAGPELAEKILLELRYLFKGRLSLALICEPWDKKYASVIKITYTDKTYDSLLSSDSLSTDRARKIKASDLMTRSGHKIVKSKVVEHTHFNVDKTIDKVTEHKGFLPLPCDVTLEINKFFVEMGKRHKIKVLISDYAYYAEKTDHIVQTMVLENTTKIKSDLHMKTEEEFRDYLYQKLDLNQEEIDRIVENNNIWAQNFNDFDLKYEYRLADSGGDALRKCLEIIKKKGRMRWDNPAYMARLKEEIDVIAKNGVKDFSAYFRPIEGAITHYTDNDELTGPSRGSAGGSLFCYLMGITQLDPIRYGLSFPRFLSLDRIKNGDIPDVDCLSPNTLIKTSIGDLTIEYLSALSESEYPKIASFDGSVDIWEVPVAIFNKGAAVISEYCLDSGEKIICTEDHRVMTPEGWMPINEAFERGMDIKIFEETGKRSF